ncbi:hypothetical protein BB561_004413 [Smittium simulii]|uniref:Uncharacterized protein n=1 Tax=Smittium simulii TaxID=133385 RepID=A0A2T9YGF5_9FUNG|nr:hypothetical protein BB561_004413 [Smittium simulii]
MYLTGKAMEWLLEEESTKAGKSATAFEDGIELLEPKTFETIHIFNNKFEKELSEIDYRYYTNNMITAIYLRHMASVNMETTEQLMLGTEWENWSLEKLMRIFNKKAESKAIIRSVVGKCPEKSLKQQVIDIHQNSTNESLENTIEELRKQMETITAHLAYTQHTLPIDTTKQLNGMLALEEFNEEVIFYWAVSNKQMKLSDIVNQKYAIPQQTAFNLQPNDTTSQQKIKRNNPLFSIKSLVKYNQRSSNAFSERILDQSLFVSVREYLEAKPLIGLLLTKSINMLTKEKATRRLALWGNSFNNAQIISSALRIKVGAVAALIGIKDLQALDTKIDYKGKSLIITYNQQELELSLHSNESLMEQENKMGLLFQKDNLLQYATFFNEDQDCLPGIKRGSFKINISSDNIRLTSYTRRYSPTEKKLIEEIKQMLANITIPLNLAKEMLPLYKPTKDRVKIDWTKMYQKAFKKNKTPTDASTYTETSRV